MANPSRYTKVGSSGRPSSETNLNDPYIQTVEFPLTIVASTSAQDTGVSTPTSSMQVIASWLKINTEETTGLTKTVDIGITGQGAVVQNDTSVASAGAAGTPLTAAISTSSSTNFTYTLGSADYAELDATCVVVFAGIDA